MYVYIPPSNQNIYGYVAPQPHYGGQVYGQNPLPYQQEPARNYNYNNYRNVESYQPLNLNLALEKSAYPPYNRDYIKNFIINDYFENNDAKVYLQEKFFVIIYTLNISFNKKSYKIIIYIHIPESFPNCPPEIYVQKKPKTGLNKTYIPKINPQDFKVNIDYFGKFEPSLNSIQNIVNSIKDSFNVDFPIYRDNSNKMEPEIFGKNNINRNRANEIIIESDNFTEEQFQTYMKNQTKDILRGKLSDFEQKYKTSQNYKELLNINAIVKKKSGNKNSSSAVPMSQDLNNLKKIKDELNGIEEGLQQEIQQIQNENKTSFEKCDEFIKIKDEKDMEYAAMRKSIEDYLVYLRKGYEKKVVSFNDMVNNTRMLSRELFSIDYLRKQRRSYC